VRHALPPLALPRSGSTGRRHVEPPSQPGRPGSPYARVIVTHDAFVEELAAARIGETFNQYRDGPRAGLLCARLRAYLEARSAASILLVGEAAGYRGARLSGVPFTSERQLAGFGPAEASATIVHRTLAELELEERVLLWNVVPTHPGTINSNRAPSRREVDAGLGFTVELVLNRRILCVGRLAQGALGGTYLRHPSHGGARVFRNGLEQAAVEFL
jgi:uracil-DNA glycosylase